LPSSVTRRVGVFASLVNVRVDVGCPLANANGCAMSSCMSDIVTSLRAELTALEDEVRKDPRLLKIERIRSLLELYKQEASDPAPQMQPPHPQPPQAVEAETTQPTRSVPGKSERSKAYRVREHIRSVLDRNGPTHRTRILEDLARADLMGQEKDPMTSLAAYLSEWRDEFASDGKGNFSLRDKGASAPNGNGSEELPLTR